MANQKGKKEVPAKLSLKISDLEIAAKDNPRLVSEILARFPSEVDRQFTDNVTALQIAARAGQLETIKILANHGADLDCFDNEDRTPLHFAVNGDQPDAVELLLKLGADMGEKDNDDRTPPQLAFEKNKSQCVKKFLDKNPKVQLKKINKNYAETSVFHEKESSLDMTGESGTRENTPSVCRFCKRENAVVTFMPCGHVVSCFTCSFANAACQDCGQVIENRSFQENPQTKEYFQKIIKNNDKRNKEIRMLKDQIECCICRDRPVDCVLKGCGHMFCHKCVRKSPAPRYANDKQIWVCFKCKERSRYLRIYADWLNNNNNE